MVAGGIGQTPFLATARQALGLRKYGQPEQTLSSLPERVSLLYGARSKEYLAGLDDFSVGGTGCFSGKPTMVRTGIKAL